MNFKPKQWQYLVNRWHLTPREAEVAKLVCRGYDNERIAGELGIRYNTVRVHLVHIFKKAGVSGKPALTVKFIDEIHKAKL
jgi:DNA-binding CsgD family transcriptional regulator